MNNTNTLSEKERPDSQGIQSLDPQSARRSDDETLTTTKLKLLSLNQKRNDPDVIMATVITAIINYGL